MSADTPAPVLPQPGPDTLVRVRGQVHAWPPGFERDLPSDRWLVVFSHLRHEKQLVKDLARMGLPGLSFYEERLRRYRGKGYQSSLVPLLSGYFFVNAGLEHRHDILALNKAKAVLPVTTPALLTRDIRSLITLVQGSQDLGNLVMRPEIVPGKRIRVTQGIFAGVEGVVRKRQGQVILVVNLDLLGHSVSTSIPAEIAELAIGPER